MVVKLRTELSPENLLEQLKQIEVEAGRKEAEDHVYHDRPIDLDILLYGDLILKTDRLTITSSVDAATPIRYGTVC